MFVDFLGMNNKDNLSASDAFDIGKLVEDLRPVSPLRLRDGMALALALALVAAILVSQTLGVRADLMAGEPHQMFFMRLGTLLIVGLAACYAAVASARPAVGSGRAQRLLPFAPLAVGALFPIAALATISRGLVDPMVELRPLIGLECLSVSGLSALGVGTALTLWLRRGAPTSPERSGWLVGLAAGGLGTAAYSIACPFNNIAYVGTWFPMAVALCAVTGRLIVPRLLRW